MRHLSFSKKFLLFVGFVTLLNAVLGAWAYSEQVDVLLQDQTKELSAVVDSAVSIVDDIYRADDGLSEQEKREKAMSVVRSIRFRTDNYIWINDLDHIVVMHPAKPELDGTDASDIQDPDGTFLFQEFVKTAKSQGAGTVLYKWPKAGSDVPVDKLSYVSLFKPWGWVVGAGIYIDQIEAAKSWIILRTIVSVLAVTAIMLSVSALFARAMAKPLTRSVQAIASLGQDNLDIDVGDTARRDEIGSLNRAVVELRAQLVERRAMIEQERAETERRERRQKAMEELLNNFSKSFRASLSRFSDVSSDMSKSADTVLHSADETTEQAIAVSAAAEEASSGAQTVSAAAQELSASIAEVTRQVEHANDLTTGAIGKSDRAKQTVTELHDAAQRINEIVDLIGSIAQQTNLLALNATIEASRAGEAGKGFAVVANEVKSLANQTAAAIEDINKNVSEMQAVAQSTDTAIRDVTDSIDGMSAISESIAAAMEQQNAATSEIVRSVSEVSTSTADVAQAIDTVRGAAENSGQAASGVAATAKHLSDETTMLSDEVGHFLQEIERVSDRRDFQRVETTAPITVTCKGARYDGALADFGGGGCSMVVQGLTPATGQTVEIEINGISLRGTIVEIGDCLHVQFSLNPENAERADRILATLKA
ncbi:HAMP domain-containing protein [Rhodospirillaceae bacterium KN72]|uniref:HAMP domain-containing protein n=1 Tax=Pacificispira spongiicola TaxID=2729598 RepID=A0A7Y0E0N7_9PROT|nr:cache domain-containing protein [Pacificispira spongiicola]NMM45060.1 HAMP domain-containing protein [Pacificispira spongiicola]